MLVKINSNFLSFTAVTDVLNVWYEDIFQERIPTVYWKVTYYNFLLRSL